MTLNTMDVPAEALAVDTTLSITDAGSNFALVTNDEGTATAVFAVDIEPSGTVFDPPMTLVFKWDDANNDGEVDDTDPPILEDNLRISKDGEIITGTCESEMGCNRILNTFTVEVSSLSKFALITTSQPPEAVAVIEQLTDIGTTASVRLDGSGSSDPDDPLSSLTFTWTVDGVVVCDLPDSCKTIEVALAFGSHEVILIVTDLEGFSDEDTNTVTIDPSQLAVFVVNKVKVEFGKTPPRAKIRGEIGLPFGVDFSELAPQATVSLKVAGIDLLSPSAVSFEIKGAKEKEWKFEDKSASSGITKFHIDWKGARFRFKERGFPVKLKT